MHQSVRGRERISFPTSRSRVCHLSSESTRRYRARYRCVEHALARGAHKPAALADGAPRVNPQYMGLVAHPTAVRPRA